MQVPVFVSAAEILARLLTVDSDSSGLNANTLQGYQASAFSLAAHTHSYQPLDAELTAIAGLTSAANKVPYFTGLGTADMLTVGTGALNLVQLTAASKLPAVDGSLLTNLPAPSGVLLATGATTGATSQAQTFTNPLIATAGMRPAADTTAYKWFTKADGTTAIVTVNTTDRSLIFPASANASAAFSGFEMAAPDGTKVASFQSIQDVGGSTLTFFSNNRKFGSGAWSVSGYPTNRPGITHYMKDEFWSLWTFTAGSASAIFLLNAGPTGVRINPGSGNDIAAATALLELGASTATRASLRLREGVAPTSPNNGDLWVTTAGLYVRINGATVGPLS